MKCLIFIFSLFLNCSIAQTFIEKNVKFPSKDQSFLLSGTLAIPIDHKPKAVVVLISGSGQTDRDATVFGHKVFKTISDHLVKNNIGVLRYDDRGGFKSDGPKTSQSTQIQLASDAEAAVSYLSKTEKFKNIGIIGHSEGGGLAPMVASKKVNFIISLAGIVLKGADLMVFQNQTIYSKLGVDSQQVKLYLNKFYRPIMEMALNKPDSLSFINLFANISKEYIASDPNIPFPFLASSNTSAAPIFYKQFCSPWMIDMLQTDYLPYWQKVKIPSLVIFGSLDQQVDAELNKSALDRLHKKNIETITLKDQNHLFQKVKKGSIDEYSSTKYVFSEECLSIITKFIYENQ